MLPALKILLMTNVQATNVSPFTHSETDLRPGRIQPFPGHLGTGEVFNLQASTQGIFVWVSGYTHLSETPWHVHSLLYFSNLGILRTLQRAGAGEFGWRHWYDSQMETSATGRVLRPWTSSCQMLALTASLVSIIVEEAFILLKLTEHSVVKTFNNGYVF